METTGYGKFVMNQPIGCKHWAIAEGYIPAYSNGPEPQFTSHETVCILNTADQDAHVQITIFYSNKEPIGPYQITIPARRTKHIRFNDQLTQSQFLTILTSPAQSSQTYLSLYNIPVSTPDKRRMPCSVLWLMLTALR